VSFIVVGTNHKYSPIALRERLSFSKRRLKDTLSFLREKEVLKGAVILSTCNRTEIYASAEDSKSGIKAIEDFISRYHEIENNKFTPYLYTYRGKQALKHLFSVACGLDSLILGETQIFGQVKSSLLEAQDADFVDEFLRKIFQSALSFAKTIHSETKISEGKVSIGSVAIDFIKEKFGSLSNKNILIIGVGKVSELVLQYLEKENPNVVFISNRTFERAKDLAGQIGAKVERFDELGQSLNKADVVITATASPHFVIKKENLEKIATRRLSIIDLALPRDVDPRVRELRNVDLFCLEDLGVVIKKNVAGKMQEAKKVKAIIDTEAEKIWIKLTKLEQELVLSP